MANASASGNATYVVGAAQTIARIGHAALVAAENGWGKRQWLVISG